MGKSLLLAAFLPLFACSSENPNGPTDVSDGMPGAMTLSVVAARTGAPVTGASVTLVRGDGTMSPLGVTDGHGTLSLSIPITQVLLIEAPGFLRRHIMSRSGAINERLWENDAELPRSFSTELVYHSYSGGFRELRRPTAAVLTVIPRGEMLINTRVQSALPAAVAAVNAAAGGRTRFVIDPAGSGAEYPITVTLNPWNTANPGELTWSYSRQDGRLYKCDIEVGGIEGFWGFHLQRMLQHALTHCLGLVHAPGYPGIMGDQEPQDLEFLPMETQVMRNIFLRQPGNRMDDIDRDVSERSVPTAQSIVSEAGPVCAVPAPRQ